MSGEPGESTTDNDLIGGTYTTLRPEIGQLGIFGGCTATLVDARFAVTAAHCVKYTTQNVSGTFQITRSDGSLVNYSVDKTWALGKGDPNNLSNGLGDTDVALVRLTAPVATTDARPTYIWPWWPGVGTTQTIFGYGCQSRSTGTGGGIKQYYQFIAGDPSSELCPGDSGGPVVWYGPSSSGPVFAINSGYHSDGSDIFANASEYAIPGLEAVKRFSSTTVTNAGIASFEDWAQQSGVKAVSGDFNGDGLTDVALLGGPGWWTLPVAFSNGDGTFRVTNIGLPPGGVTTWTQQATQAVAGDFNGDGLTDIAMTGGPGWVTIPILYANGDGSFRYTNSYRADFAGWAETYGAQVLAGDFNGDGRSDLALVGGSGWSTIPVAFSNGDGTFQIQNQSSPTFASWAQSGLGPWTRQVQAVAGDFDGDGDDDIALVGGSGWGTIPVAFSNRAGGFAITNNGVAHFPAWASNSWYSGNKVLASDFDGDGRADLALVGGYDWITVAFALSSGGGNFTAANLPIASFPGWAHDARFALTGNFKPRFRFTPFKPDIALVGGSGWGTLPVAFLSY